MTMTHTSRLGRVEFDRIEDSQEVVAVGPSPGLSSPTRDAWVLARRAARRAAAARLFGEDRLKEAMSLRGQATE